MIEREVLDELIEEGKVFNVYTKRMEIELPYQWI